ncbi:MAG: hypothetical protein NUV91_03485 [Candidatus Omnitrophica bacterium]|nr:hypothetical protein [Candidatus Omnitrophota bacterium]
MLRKISGLILIVASVSMMALRAESVENQTLSPEDMAIIQNLELLEMLEEFKGEEDLDVWENYEVVERIEGETDEN